ncbi:hybrid sensor histidine kinase/response regulator [Pseudodesulfovibrio cashew]|uniref:hybrid sensor histidine kinase/response regulator n=1 Tax=Pseudodesulfovibrio cashew TaxID=2678688 RepID=UPI00131D2DD5|nr:hybrid sensor histidine kinase/response regulator [Pseudodesulfovibrio cashew]
MKHAAVSQTPPILLIVEDSKLVRGELKRAIGSAFAFQIEMVASYEEAREYLDWHSRDIFLAILDLNLPGSPSGEIVDLFCSMRVPSLVLTSDFTETTRERMQSKEIIDYLVKDAHAVENVLAYIDRLYRNRSTKVMVVEDSELSRLYVSSLLHRQMFKVIDVPDAESGLRILEQQDDVGLVIIDYALPGMDGIELTQRIREKFSKETMAVIGLSSVSDTMLTARFLKNGANDFITKPFEVEGFFCRINHNVEMLDSMRALRDANMVKNQFLGMAVHDLRSPINGINGLAEMLLSDMCGPINEEQREIIGYIRTANRQMNALVSDLLDISVIESGKLELVLDQRNLREVVEQRLRIQGFAAKRKNILLKRTLEDVREFRFDRNRVGQVLDNLLSNAIKFSPVSEVIEISMGEEDGHAVICVTDHGQGIPPDEADLLFQTFRKTSVQPTAGESGAGLGLAIVHKIVLAHRGRVWVESEYGKGATFCFSLPLDTSSDSGD